MKVIIYRLLCGIEAFTIALLALTIWSFMHCDSIACASPMERLNWDNWRMLVWGSMPVVAIVIFHYAVTRRLIRTRNTPDYSPVALTSTESLKERKWTSPSLMWLKNNMGVLSLLVVCVGGGYFLKSINNWESGDAKPRPFHFSVLVYNKTDDKLFKVVYAQSDNTIEQFNENTSDYTYLLPFNAKNNYPFQDGDTVFSVKRLSEKEQIITVGYEIGIGNSGSSTYRARDKSVEPISTEEGGAIAYTVSFVVWLLVLMLYGIVKGFFYLLAAIKSR